MGIGPRRLDRRQRRPRTRSDAVIDADADTLLAWPTGRLDDTEALAAGLRVGGGRRSLRRLRALFPTAVTHGRDSPPLTAAERRP